jgi:CheY-like chemotaxis protein
MTSRKAPLILLVDDFEDAREMYRLYLEYTGYRVVEAASGKEAVQKARDLQPDVILMDLSMPDVDGWEATRILKADKLTSGIPVMALTGHALAGHSDVARRAGCDAFVTKPCLPADLVKELEKMLDSSGRKHKRG